MALGKPNERLAKRFGRQLRECQQEDKPLPEPWLLSIRYYLPFLRWRHIGICVEPNALEPSQIDIPRAMIPEFFQSQLEPQRLISRHLPRIPLSPLLDFVLGIVPENARKGFPLLIRSYSRTRRRTHQIFLFSAVTIMPRDRPYTLEELLTIRDQKAPKNLRSILTKDPDLSALIPKGKQEDQKHERDGGSTSEYHCPEKTAKKVKSDESSSSDEVLWKGRAVHRQQVSRMKQEQQRLRKSSESTKTPASLAPAPSKATEETSTQTAKEAGFQAGDSSETDPDEPVEMVWKYRGRTEEEKHASTPIQPPAGDLAQKSEGFKRFFKAVKSPDHVRVTAGGRIVPNSRGLTGSSSPVPNQRADNPLKADNPTISTTDRTDQAIPPFYQISQYQGPSQIQPNLLSPILPAFSSIVAVPYGAPPPPGYQFRPPPAAYYPAPPQGTQYVQMVPISVNSALKDTHNTMPNDEHVDNDHSGLAPEKTDRVKVSPPEQFDGSKPFFFNGQVMYPAPSHFHSHSGGFVPLQPMLGIPPGGPQHFGSPLMAPLPPSPGMLIPMMSAPGFGAPPGGLPGPHGVMSPAVLPVGPVPRPKGPAPSASTIKMSAITQSHINSFKSKLKYLQDQLQFNRHQIDETFVNEEIKRTKENIHKFEAQLKKHEEEEVMTERKIDATMDHAVSPTPRKPQPAIEEKAVPKPSDYYVNDGASSLSGSVKFNCGDDKPAYDWRTQPSALPSEAALAPPFQPRGIRETASFDARLLALEAQGESDQRGPAAGKMPSKQASRESMSRTRDWLATSGTRVHADSPYLVGQLPYGVSQTSKHVEYVYSRPLSHDERRARELYWGHGHQPAQSGLPKFDGQNFYPASPTKKGNLDSNQTPKTSGHRISVRTTPAAPKTMPGSDPFRPVTPKHQSDMAHLDSSDDGSTGLSGMPAHRTCSVAQVSLADDYDKSPCAGITSNALPISTLHISHPKASESMAVLKSRENSVETASSYDRRSEKAGGARLWENVLKKPSASSALSSTTVHGLLPQYTGHAAASFSPSMARNSASPLRNVSSGKISEVEPLEGDADPASASEKLEENRPLHRAA